MIFLKKYIKKILGNPLRPGRNGPWAFDTHLGGGSGGAFFFN
jgi:hypothetical protein